MKTERLRLLLQHANVSQCARDSGVPIRTLWRFKAGGKATKATLQKLAAWGKGRHLPKGVTVPKPGTLVAREPAVDTTVDPIDEALGLT